MILCAGEALIDMIPNSDGLFVPHVGGAVLNTAVALGRLGEDVGLITGLSADPFGQLIQNHLTESHVSISTAVRSDRNTTLAFVHLNDGQATYSFYDAHTATRDIQTSDLPAIPETVQAMFFGGISLCNAPVADTLLDLAIAQPNDRLIMADPNIRPGFVSDHVGYRTRLTRLIERADIIKLSDEDIEWLIPDGDLQAKASAVLDMGPTMLLLTEGKAGSTACMADGRRIKAPAQIAQVVDTVGAGDTFNAGCLASLRRAGAMSPSSLADLSDDTLSDMLSLAARAAAVTVSRAGANPPWQSELE